MIEILPLENNLIVEVALSDHKSVVEIEKPLINVVNNQQSGIVYNRSMLFSNALTSYFINDEGYLNSINYFKQDNLPVNPISFAQLDANAQNKFITLVDDNYFGNKNRFTDKIGGQNYADNEEYLIDHLTGLGWYLVPQSDNNDHNLYEFAETIVPSYTRSGYSDWYLPTIKAFNSIRNTGNTGGRRVFSEMPYFQDTHYVISNILITTISVIRSSVFVEMIDIFYNESYRLDARNGLNRNIILMRKHF